MSQLEMDSGPRFVKPAIIGAIAVLFAGGIYTLSQSSDTMEKKPAEAQTAMAGDGNAPTSPEGAAGATPGAPSPTADMSAASDPAATPAPTDTAMPAAAMPEPTAALEANSTPAAMETAAAAPMPAAAPASEPAADTTSSDSAAAQPQESTQVAVKDEQPNREAVRPPAAPAVDALRPWWNQSASDDRFGVQYVGQAADQPALVIRFSRQVTDPAAAQNIKLIGANGEAVAANWAQGQSPNVLYAPNLQPGRYTVVIDPQMASADGQSLGTQLHGPTYIR